MVSKIERRNKIKTRIRGKISGTGSPSAHDGVP